MRLIHYLLLILLFRSLVFAAGEIFIKEGSLISEVIIRVPSEYVKDYKVNGANAEINFNKKFNLNLGEYNKKIIKNITKKESSILLTINPWASMYIAKEKDQLKIVIANTPKKSSEFNINMVSPIPVEDQSYKNVESEKAIANLRLKLKEQDYEGAIKIADELIAKNPLDKYGEEALYLSGLANIELGKESDKNLFTASSTFDEFTRKFPKSRLLGDAYLKSAEVKEKLGFKNEAVFVYQEMIKNLKDEKYASIAYTKVGQLYNELGQPDRALKYFTDYIQKNNPDNSPIYAYVGSIYAQKGDFVKAEEYFSKYKPKKIEDLPPDTLFWMAEVLNHKNELDSALKYYTVIYNRFPDYEKADMAMYRAGVILISKDKKDLGINLLKDTKLKYSQKHGGILSAVKVAEETLNSNDSEFWSVYLADAIKNDIDPKLAIKALKLLVTSYINDKKYDNALKQIELSEKKFSSMPEFNELYHLKEEIFYSVLKGAFSSGDYAKAEKTIETFLSEFPKSQRVNEILSIREEIKYIYAKKAFDAKQYINSLKLIEDYLSKNKQLYHKDKWYSLWEDALYNVTIGFKNDPVKFGLYGREFISIFPSSSKVASIKETISKNILSEFQTILNKKDYYNTVVFYQRNKGDIEKHPQKEFFLANVAYALFMLGEKEKAASILKTIKYSNNETELVKMMTNIKPNNFNINNYSLANFNKIIDDLIKIDIMKAYQIAISYKKDRLAGVKKAVTVIEQMSDNQKRSIMQSFLNEIAKENQNIKKEGYKIYFYHADNLFMNKNFKGAIESYRNYISFAPKNDPNMPDALYFIGKSYINIDEKDMGGKYLNDLITKYPNHQYATLAKSEIEDLKWKSMKK
ncbi:MAG: tetratricopeptide repeat protein [Calditerrivibrio sp.]|nr:tetratricopeptide repeat protein [Calditerrivibrio sp.]